MPETTNEEELLFWVTVCGGVLGILVIVSLAKWWHGFEQELKHLKGEIKRTSGRERKYWIRKKRRLWLSVLPFVKY